MEEIKQLNDRPRRRAISLEDKRIQRIRARSSYLLFRQLYEFLKNKPDVADILKRFSEVLQHGRNKTTK